MKPLDLPAKRFLMACALLFVAAVALRLNGSSTFVWKEILHDTANPGGLILGAPQYIRSDEWLVWTPAVLAQSERGFPVESPALGAGKAPFLYSLPVRHYTMWFRPQLYGFFLFDLDWGYAWYWNVKVFGLLTSMFLLLRMLTGSNALGLFGSIWIFFSNYIQWWFSCPPMLPEMLSSWGLAIVMAVILLRTTRWWVRLSAATMFVVCSVNFILCLYPPFQIPLVYLGIALLVGYVLASDNSEWRRQGWLGPIVLLGACVFTVATLVPFFIECRPTFEALSSTSYPGHRRSHGGELSWIQLFSGLMNLFNSERAYPDSFKQANEAANFIPFWLPVLMFVGRDLLREPRKHAVAIGALAVLLGLSLYAIFPLPEWLCHATLLSFCTEVRALLVIGVANVVFVTVTFPLLKRRIGSMRRRSWITMIGIASCLLLIYLWRASYENPIFLSPWRIAMFLILDIGLLVVLIKTPARVFQAATIALLCLSNGLINPVMAGVDPLRKATPAFAIRELIRRDPSSAWAVYESNQLSEFFMAMGANVVSGVKTVPDLEFYRSIDPNGQYLPVYNRYSFAFFEFPAYRSEVDIQAGGFPTHLVGIHPLNPALRARRVRYFVFTAELARPSAEGLSLLAAFPSNRIWIYRESGWSPP